MQRPRRKTEPRKHVCIIVNESATDYRPESIDRLTDAIRKRGDQFTVVRPRTAHDLSDTAQAACGRRRGRRLLPQTFQRRGQVTSLVSCGGDGTFNLVARAALAADIPIGILPMGRFNNIARSLYTDLSAAASAKRITGSDIRSIDVGNVSGQPFFGAIGLGLIPRLMKILSNQKTPRLGLSWARVVSQAASEIETMKMVVKVDAFRFEISPTILNVNLLSYAGGLNLSPASLTDDRRAEIIFDMSATRGELGTYARRIHSEKFVYGSGVRLFRGAVITIQPIKGRTLYLDGELVELPTNLIEIKIEDKQLKVHQ